MTPHDETAMLQSLQELAALYAQVHAIAAPYDTQIRSLEIARADATSAITFHIDTLQAQLRPLLLAAQRTIKVEGCTASYCHKETWDSAALKRFAEEVPAIMQCVRDSSYVVFRASRT